MKAATPALLPCPPDQADEFLSTPTPATIAALAAQPGPVLVLGAGGKMGFHLCRMARRALDAAGRRHPVIAVSRFRRAEERSAFAHSGIVVHASDLTDAGQLAQLPDAPTVFYLAGVKFGTAGDPALLRKMNADVPRNVAQRFHRSRLVAFSSGCVYPFMTPKSGGATERTPPAPVGDYAASCVAREEAFGKISRRHGTSVALIRLNYAVEFRYGLLVDIALRVMNGQPVDVTTGYVNVIWQRDAIDHIIQTLALAASPAVPINITGPEILSVRSLAHRFGELFDRPATIVGKEADTAWLNDASHSHRLFGPPSITIEQMTTWTAAWLRSGGATLGKPTGFQNRDGRF